MDGSVGSRAVAEPWQGRSPVGDGSGQDAQSWLGVLFGGFWRHVGGILQWGEERMSGCEQAVR